MISETNKLPSDWKLVKLEDICDTKSGGTPSRNIPLYYKGNIPWVKSGELNDCSIYITEESITEEAVKKSSAKVFLFGTLLIALYGATVGKLGILKINAATNQAVCAIFPKSLIQRDYLYYYLLSQRSNLIKSSTGGAQPNISQEIIRNLIIPLPPLPEQKRIAAILEKCDRLRRTRRYSLQLSETFLQSVFLEMFGDQKNLYERKTFNEVCLKIFDCKHYTPPYVLEGIPLIRTNDVEPGFFKFGSTVHVSPEEYEKLTDLNKPAKEDIVFAREGSFGVASYINENYKYAIGQRMMLLRANKSQINPIYLTHFINSASAQEYLLQVSMGTTVKRVNVGDVKELPVPLPPLPLQEKFAQIVQKHERFRTQQREAQRQAEHLFQTLLHHAFRGELTSSDSKEVDISALSAEA